MSNGFKKWFAAAVMAMAFVGQSNAASTTSTTAVGDLATFSAGMNYFSPATTTGSSFADTFTFNLTGPGRFAAVLTSITLAPVVGISNFMLELRGPGNVFLNSFAATTTGMLSLIQTGPRSLAAGSGYSAIVSGVVSGTYGGSYSVNMVAAPVPEPAEWMMLAAGLLVMGFIARRRKNIA